MSLQPGLRRALMALFGALALLALLAIVVVVLVAPDDAEAWILGCLGVVLACVVGEVVVLLLGRRAPAPADEEVVL